MQFPSLAAACERVCAEIDKVCARHSAPIVVAIDGGSGAGKSVLVGCIERALHIARVPLDDFFAAEIPEPQWLVFSVEERLQRVFDWQRVRADALEPLRAGQCAQWYAFDFVAGLRSDGTYGMQSEPVTLAPADVIVLDGAYSACQELSDLVDLTVLVDVSVSERHARLASREDAAFLQHWHEIWDPVESYYFTVVRPSSTFDVVVKNG